MTLCLLGLSLAPIGLFWLTDLLGEKPSPVVICYQIKVQVSPNNPEEMRRHRDLAARCGPGQPYRPVHADVPATLGPNPAAAPLGPSGSGVVQRLDHGGACACRTHLLTVTPTPLQPKGAS